MANGQTQTQAPQTQQPPPSGQTVPAFSPDGTLGDIPVERVHDAVKSGFKLGVDLVSPDGQPGAIPVERVHDALQKGFKLPTTMPENYGFTAGNMAGLVPRAAPGAPVTESEAAKSNYATNQSKTALPMETSTLGSVYHSLSEGNETSADPRAHAAAEYGKRVQQGIDEANQGHITSAGIGVGALKGVAEGAHTLGAVGSHAINLFAPDPSLSDLVGGRKPTLVPNVPFREPKSLEAENTSETVGKIGENVLEFMTGDEALKPLGLSAKLTKLKKVAEFIKEYPRLAKAIDIPANARRQRTARGLEPIH